MLIACWKITPEIQERLETLKDAVEATDFLFAEHVSPKSKALIGKKMTAEQTLEVLKQAERLISHV